MEGVLAWARLDLRRRWRSMLVLALLVAVAGGIVLAALAGARRTHSALDRLDRTTLPADAMVLPNQVGFDWDAVRALPSVETVGTFSLSLGRFNAPRLIGAPQSALFFPASSPETFNTVERIHITRGHRWDPNDPTQVVATKGFIAKYGDTVTLQLASPKQLDELNKLIDEGKLDPNADLPASVHLDTSVTLHVVEEGISPLGAGDPSLQISPSYGFWKKYMAGKLPDLSNALVRVRGGEAGLPAFKQQLAVLTHDKPIDVLNLAEQNRTGPQHSLTFTAEGWALFALVAFVASLVLVGQAFVRACVASASDLDTLSALGLTRREARIAAAIPPAAAGVGGALAAGGIAFALSPLFPTGLGPSVETSPGASFDSLVLVTGTAAIAAVAVLGALAAAHAVRRPQRPAPRSIVATAVTRAGLGVVATLGTRFALESGRGRSRVPARPALVGAVAAVLGVVGALTFRAGLDDAASDPARFGQTLPEVVTFGQGAPPPGALDAAKQAAQSPDIAVMDDMRINVFDVRGRSVTTFQLAPIKGSVVVVSTAGREPRSADEIALGPATANAIHAHVGDRVTVAGHELRVSGISFVPEDSHSDYSDGAWVTAAGMHVLQPDEANDKYRRIRFAWAKGVDPTAAARQLGDFGAQAYDSGTPAAQIDLIDVRTQPLLLGGFLVLLGVGALGHALTSAVRRRRHDVAVLRALGLTRRQARLTIATQASVIALVGLVFGIPLGIATGRGAWQVLAHATPVSYAAPLAALAVLLVSPAGLAVANLLAALPARRAARIRPAEVLRAE